MVTMVVRKVEIEKVQERRASFFDKGLDVVTFGKHSRSEVVKIEKVKVK